MRGITMDSTITLRGIVKSRKTIEVQDGRLNDWLNQEVTLTIKKSKHLKAVTEMLDEMREGQNIGYKRIERTQLYRV